MTSDETLEATRGLGGAAVFTWIGVALAVAALLLGGCSNALECPHPVYCVETCGGPILAGAGCGACPVGMVSTNDCADSGIPDAGTVVFPGSFSDPDAGPVFDAGHFFR